jgi:hypothetical protein
MEATMNTFCCKVSLSGMGHSLTCSVTDRGGVEIQEDEWEDFTVTASSQNEEDEPEVFDWD